MAKMYYRYGIGKTADLCQTAYNFEEKNMNILVMNPLNKEVEAKVCVDGKPLLKRDINYTILMDIYNMNYKNIRCILVDNAHLLSRDHVEELFYVSNLLDITVIAYGDRVDNALRFMELANIIEPVDGIPVIGPKLEFYFGAMNSCKTAKLLYKLYTLENAGLKVCLIKPKLDRDINKVSSRIGLEREADIVLDSKDHIYGEGYYMSKDHINYILVDEAQFLTVKQIDELTRINKEYGIPIRCYGLKTDFMTNHFSGSGRLLEISDELVKLKTVCDCGEGAEFNARTSSGEYIRSGEQISIDNNDNIKYNSLCPKCYIKKVMGIDNIQKLIK